MLKNKLKRIPSFVLFIFLVISPLQVFASIPQQEETTIFIVPVIFLYNPEQNIIVTVPLSNKEGIIPILALTYIDASNTASSKTANYTYDDLNRLTSATISAVASGQSPYTYNYTYDALGNILTGPNGSYVYSSSNYANPHAATSINAVTNTYDRNGNVLTDGTLTNVWNYNNQLTQTTKGAIVVNDYYDHQGSRVWYKVGAVNTYYPNKYYSYDGTTKIKNIYAGDTLVANITTAGTTVTPYYIHVDHLNSTNTVSNNSGALVKTLDYYPFGSQRINSGSYSAQRQYIGQFFDPDTSLNYLQTRYYQNSTGRFVSQDPVFWGEQNLFDPQSLNSYSYTNNNPITLSDPTGKSAIGDYVRNIWSKLFWSNTVVQNTTNTQTPISQNNYTQILGSDRWKSQMPDMNGCLDACKSMVGYNPVSYINVAGYDSSGKLGMLSDAQKGVATIDQYLSNNTPIIVGVNRGDGGKQLKNQNVASQHFVTINGSGTDARGKYYTFFDPGTSRRDAGTSQNNKLYLNTSNYSLSGVSEYNRKNYTVTEIKTK